MYYMHMRMKKFINLFIIWSAIVPSQLAAQVLTQRQHLPLTTDSLLGYKLPYVAILPVAEEYSLHGIAVRKREVQ